MDDLAHARLIIDNLGARLGQLMVENVELLARIYELENPDAPQEETAP